MHCGTLSSILRKYFFVLWRCEEPKSAEHCWRNRVQRRTINIKTFVFPRGSPSSSCMMILKQSKLSSIVSSKFRSVSAMKLFRLNFRRTLPQFTVFSLLAKLNLIYPPTARCTRRKSFQPWCSRDREFIYVLMPAAWKSIKNVLRLLCVKLDWRFNGFSGKAK